MFATNTTNTTNTAAATVLTAALVDRPASIIEVGEIVKFTVAATGSDLTYQWQYRTPNFKWVECPFLGCHTERMFVRATEARTLGVDHVRCVVTDTHGSTATTEVAEFEVLKHLSANIRNTHIVSLEGDDVRIIPELEGDIYKIQWQYKTPFSDSWVDVLEDGRDEYLYIPAHKVRHGRQYRCVVTDIGFRRVHTAPVTMMIAGYGPAITAEPESVCTAFGTTAKFTVTAEGTRLTYQWQYMAPGSGKWANAILVGNNTPTLFVPTTASRNYSYRCVITDAFGLKAFTMPVGVNIINP